jgi:hypothetical protein
MKDIWRFHNMLNLVEPIQIDEAIRKPKTEEEARAEREKDIADRYAGRAKSIRARRKDKGKVGGVGSPEKIAMGSVKEKTDPMGQAVVMAAQQYKQYEEEGPNYQPPEDEPKVWGTDRDPLEVLKGIAGVAGGRLSGITASKQIRKLKNALMMIQGKEPLSEDLPVVEDPTTGKMIPVSWDTLADMKSDTSAWAWLTTKRRDRGFQKKEREWERENLGDRGAGAGEAMSGMDAFNKWIELSGYEPEDDSDPDWSMLHGVMQNLSRATSRFIGRSVNKNELARAFLGYIKNAIDTNPLDPKLDNLKKLARPSLKPDGTPTYGPSIRKIQKALDILAQIPWDDASQKFTAAPYIVEDPEDGNNFRVFPDAKEMSPEEQEAYLAEIDPGSVGHGREKPASIADRTSVGQIEKEIGLEREAMPHPDERIKGSGDEFVGLRGKEGEEVIDQKQYTFTDKEMLQRENEVKNLFDQEKTPNGLPKGDAAMLQHHYMQDRRHIGDPAGTDWELQAQIISARLHNVSRYFEKAAEFFRENGMAQKAKDALYRAKVVDFKTREWEAWWDAQSQRAKAAQQPVAKPQVQVPKPTTTTQIGRKTDVSATPATDRPKYDTSGLFDHTEALQEVRAAFNKLMKKANVVNESHRPKKEWLNKTKEWLKKVQ